MKRVRIELHESDFACIAEVADGHWTRFWGLMGRRSLGDGSGLWLRPSTSVHTFFMRFPIDLVYLGAENEVVKTSSDVGPGHLSFGGRGARTVLELPAGSLRRAPLAVGARLSTSPVDSDAVIATQGDSLPAEQDGARR